MTDKHSGEWDTLVSIHNHNWEEPRVHHMGERRLTAYLCRCGARKFVEAQQEGTTTTMWEPNEVEREGK